MTSTEDMAKKFAERHHSAIGQLRKYTEELYITHPAAVVELVRSVPHTPEMLAAAWLHDTVEDTARPWRKSSRNLALRSPPWSKC